MKYKTLFDRITPPKTDDEMIKLVLSGGVEALPALKESAPKKRSFRKSAVCAAAAAALAVGVTAAGASFGWDFSGLFEGFYSRISSEAQGYVDTGIENQNHTADLSQMGISLNKTVDFGCGTVTFTGAAADRNTVLVMYDLAINEKALEEYHGKFGSSDKSPRAELELSENPAGCNLAAGYGTPNDTSGVVSYTSVYFYQNGFLTEDSVMELEFVKVAIFDGASRLEIELEQPVKLSFPLDFMNTEYVSVSPDADITIDNYEYHIDEVVITPLSIQWYAERGGRTGKLEGVIDPLICKFADGAEVRNYQISGASEYSGGREFFTVLFDKPVNPADLVSVKIGGCEIPLNDF